MLFFFFICFFVFDLYESPKYLMGRGKEELAVEIVHKVAEYNGKTSNLTLEDLRRVGSYTVRADDPEGQQDTSVLAAVRRQFRKFSGDHVRALFATPKLAWSTSLLIIIWGLYSCELSVTIKVLMVCYLQHSSVSHFHCITASLHTSLLPEEQSSAMDLSTLLVCLCTNHLVVFGPHSLSSIDRNVTQS